MFIIYFAMFSITENKVKWPVDFSLVIVSIHLYHRLLSRPMSKEVHFSHDSSKVVMNAIREFRSSEMVFLATLLYNYRT